MTDFFVNSIGVDRGEGVLVQLAGVLSCCRMMTAQEKPGPLHRNPIRMCFKASGRPWRTPQSAVTPGKSSQEPPLTMNLDSSHSVWVKVYSNTIPACSIILYGSAPDGCLPCRRTKIITNGLENLPVLSSFWAGKTGRFSGCFGPVKRLFTARLTLLLS